MKKTIRHQYLFSQSAEMVWEYLTNSELMELWLMKNTFKPVLGAEFQFRSNPIPSLDFDGIFYCKVLEIEPYRKLSYSWQSGPGDGLISLESVVEWKLETSEKGTTLFLEHSGFAKPENEAFYAGLNHGWTEKLENINNLLNGNNHVNTCS